jgi:hypothetical protein
VLLALKFAVEVTNGREREMRSQVSDECEVKLKCFPVVEYARKSCDVGCDEMTPVGVPNFPFCRPRERPGIHKSKRKEGKEERDTGEKKAPGPRRPSSPMGGSRWWCR